MENKTSSLVFYPETKPVLLKVCASESRGQIHLHYAESSQTCAKRKTVWASVASDKVGFAYHRLRSFTICKQACIVLAGTVVPQPQKSSAEAAVKKAPMRRAFWFFLSAQKERKLCLNQDNYKLPLNKYCLAKNN